MPRIAPLTANARKTEKILKLLPKQAILAKEFGESPQCISYRYTHIWQKEIEEVLKLLDLAGYEVREKEEI